MLAVLVPGLDRSGLLKGGLGRKLCGIGGIERVGALGRRGLGPPPRWVDMGAGARLSRGDRSVADRPGRSRVLLSWVGKMGRAPPLRPDDLYQAYGFGIDRSPGFESQLDVNTLARLAVTATQPLVHVGVEAAVTPGSNGADAVQRTGGVDGELDGFEWLTLRVVVDKQADSQHLGAGL